MCYTPCHAEEADRLTKHLLPMHTVEAADSSTPLRSAQNDSALMTSGLEVTQDVIMEQCEGDQSEARVLHPHDQQIRSSALVGE